MISLILPRIRVPKFPSNDQEMDVYGFPGLLEECADRSGSLADVGDLVDGRVVLEPTGTHVFRKQRNRRLKDESGLEGKKVSQQLTTQNSMVLVSAWNLNPSLKAATHPN